jgi:methionine-rich copper-binding protein CopC
MSWRIRGVLAGPKSYRVPVVTPRPAPRWGRVLSSARLDESEIAREMKRLLQRFAVLLLVMWTASTAGAHAVLDDSVPAPRSTVRASPKELRLKFTQRLEPAFSSVHVFDAKGKQVDRGDSSTDAGDPTSLRVSLPPLSAGRYRVSWRVLSVDTHATQGDFTFDVAR